MAGLVAYESSDEEEEVKSQPISEPPRKTEAGTADANSTPSTATKETSLETPQSKTKADEEPAVYGPQIGPSSGPSFPPLEEDPASAAEALLPPGSPYTATRALLRDLTLPAVPDMNIPPSPPGSPLASTSKKFEDFLELKKKGVHFNSRVADNTSMKNPALMDKLLGFADFEHRDQYRTTLPADIYCDPDTFPREAYKEQLSESQRNIARARARAAGEPVKFVAAETATAAVAAGSSSTEEGKARKRKTRFDS